MWITGLTVGGRCFDKTMSISELHHRHGPVQLLAEAVALVREAAEAMYAGQCDEDLISTVELVEQARSALAAVQAGAVAEADHRSLAKDRLHYASTAQWLTHMGGLRKGEGKRIVDRARALTGPLTATREALVAGTASPEQTDVIVKAVDQLPLGEAVRRRGERVLLEHATRFDASDLDRTGRHLVHVVDPDAQERRLERALDREERAAHTDRFLSISSDGMGGIRIKGRGSAEDGATLKAALLPLTTPTTDHETEECDRPERDPRNGGARMWDALLQVAQHALDTKLPPDSHGAPARLLLTVELEALRAGLADNAVAGMAGVGVTSDGTDLSAATIRRLACDAEVVPVVLGTHGEPLDVGRARRSVTQPLWTALVARDRHCAFPDCDRPPVMCHAHHIRHWLFHGKTKLRNLVLLCGHHHRVVHHTPWEVRLNPDDQLPEFLPPPKHGIERQRIRHRPRRE